jgi:hypothetical protein
MKIAGFPTLYPANEVKKHGGRTATTAPTAPTTTQ